MQLPMFNQSLPTWSSSVATKAVYQWLPINCQRKLSRHIKLNHTNIALLFQEATQNIENSRIIEQSIPISLCSSLCLLQFALPAPSSTAGYFQFLDTVLNVKISFSKLSLAKYHCLHKKWYISHVFSYNRTSLQISLL